MSPYRRSLRIIGVVLIGYGALCATHAGEFWPFSIYPMFSSAGRPWTRALVRAVDTDPSDSRLWAQYRLSSVPGEPIALSTLGVHQNDLANYLEKTTVWDHDHLARISNLIPRSSLQGRNLLIMKVKGQLSLRDRVDISVTPVLLLTRDSTYVSPAQQGYDP